jgi:hypothetical protein
MSLITLVTNDCGTSLALDPRDVFVGGEDVLLRYAVTCSRGITDHVM